MAQVDAVFVDLATVDSVEVVAELPIGPLVDVGDVASVEGFTSTVANRFPVPPSATAFLTGIDAMIDEPLVFDALIAPYVITGALNPQALYLEPTIGQIWPRTG